MIRIERYDYLWGYTAAQVELMMCDAPVMKYKHDKHSGTEPKPGEKGFKRTAEEAQAAYEKWKARKKMSLDAFMRTGERKPAENK